jgi:hypothetical protein
MIGASAAAKLTVMALYAATATIRTQNPILAVAVIGRAPRECFIG